MASSKGSASQGAQSKGSVASRDHVDRLLATLSSACASLGVDVEDIDVTSSGRRTRLRVVVDADGGVDLDAIAAVSQQVSLALDEPDRAGAVLDEITRGGPYTLEVTSPGVDRPLTLPRHWRRNIGRLVDIAMSDGGQRHGRIVEATEADVTIVEGSGEARVDFTCIQRATIRIEFTRPVEGR